MVKGMDLYLKLRWGGGGGGVGGRWRRLKYPLLWLVGLLLLLLLLFVLLGWWSEVSMLSALTTRRSTRTVVLWTRAVETSLTWTFIHLSRFRFPHCNTKSDDVVCPLGSKLVLWALLWVGVLLVLPLLLLLNESFSIYFLYTCPIPPKKKKKEGDKAINVA
jgi:hypothetical protein